jgi:hypothetical protein
MTKSKQPEEKNQKFEEYMKWIKKTDDILEDDLRLIGHIHDMES